MEVNFWLTVNDNGAVRISKGKPNLRWDEVSVHFGVSIPDALFTKPHLEATVTIPEEAAIQEPLTGIVVANCKEAIKTATGLEMSVRVVDPEKEE